MPSERPAIDRLTGQDLSMLGSQVYGWPQDIGAIAILDGDGLVDPDGRFRIEAVRDAVARRLPLLPRLHQVVIPPAPRSWPSTVDRRRRGRPGTPPTGTTAGRP